jgi:hypothetical protein
MTESGIAVRLPGYRTRVARRVSLWEVAGGDGKCGCGGRVVTWGVGEAAALMRGVDMGDDERLGGGTMSLRG